MYETDNLKNAIQSCLSKVRSGKQFPVIWMVEEIVTAMAKLKLFHSEGNAGLETIVTAQPNLNLT